MVGAIVQARMGSTRLPGKVLLEAAGKTLLEHLVERLHYCKSIGRVVVATTGSSRDDIIVNLCDKRGIEVFRGSEFDVLDRYYQAAQFYGFDVVARITSDCPLVDPSLTEQMISFFLDHPSEYDLVTNRHPLTFPDGLDVDVMSIASLAQAWRNATESHQREHTIPYFWESGMRVFNFECSENLFSRHRWTLDYREDYQLIKTIFENLYVPGYPFSMHEILAFLESRPQLSAINARHRPNHA